MQAISDRQKMNNANAQDPATDNGTNEHVDNGNGNTDNGITEETDNFNEEKEQPLANNNTTT